jgi:hypothetical protein
VKKDAFEELRLALSKVGLSRRIMGRQHVFTGC